MPAISQQMATLPPLRHSVFRHPPVSLPPEPYQSNISPFSPVPRPITWTPGSEKRLPELTARVESLEKEARRMVEAAGERAVRNATLPGLEPIFPNTGTNGNSEQGRRERRSTPVSEGLQDGAESGQTQEYERA